MPDQRIFCNTPWYELHIYWDGSLGICCQEDHKLYGQDQVYNIATTSIRDWFNSLPVRQFRLGVLGHDPVSACRRCYVEEGSNSISRRIRSNAKSVIFTRQAFDQSFQQSPGHGHFTHSQQHDGHAHTLPIDLHIDLGNFCNLACKMCEPRASSTIAAQQVKWGIESSRQYLGTDWTRDDRVWRGFLDQLLDIPNLKNIHFMGGETLLTKKFDELVAVLDQHQRHSVGFSFVTNGTVYRPELMERLSRFNRVGIEISVETMTDHNSYQRQGTDNALVRRNIELYREWTAQDHITVTLRPVLSILTVGHYHTLLDYALQNQLVVKSLSCIDPAFMRVELLPRDIKDIYIERLNTWAGQLNWSDRQDRDFNASDPHNTPLLVQDQINMMRTLLARPSPDDSEIHLEALVRHCERWDRVYGLDALALYPELAHIFQRHGYAV